MEYTKKLVPVGIEDFDMLIKDNYYYIDKTGLIKELLTTGGAVSLFTRPRRFGKTLNMSMLKCFFSVDGDKSIFDGLEISKEKNLCKEYMGRFPVIYVSLKGINGMTYETARLMAVQVVNEAAMAVQYLLESRRLTKEDKEAFLGLLKRDMDDARLCSSLRELSRLLEKHHESRVILLIDEYDVPLAKAFENGYYEPMAFLLRGLLEQALKTNSSLKLSALTGCMLINMEAPSSLGSKTFRQVSEVGFPARLEGTSPSSQCQSIFTGLNNLKVLSVADVEFDEYFGFTDCEVKKLLEYYDRMDSYGVIKEWYDGYQFGDAEIYCPWDVICHCWKLQADRNAQPQNYWINTSGNDAVRHFIQQGDKGSTKRELERLVNGEVVVKEIRQELTYKDMYNSIDNIWSLLFTTGYLTQRGRPRGNYFSLMIPNKEIRYIFTAQIMEFFKEAVCKNGERLNAFCDALERGQAELVEKYFGEYLRKTISIRDTSVRKPMKENFYHGILLGILGVRDDWDVSSNRESGDGYTDILAETGDMNTGIIIEVKYAHNGDLDSASKEALEQTRRLGYEEILEDDGIKRIIKYGIACYKKRCRVLAE